jgi:hypothetical protein
MALGDGLCLWAAWRLEVNLAPRARIRAAPLYDGCWIGEGLQKWVDTIDIDMDLARPYYGSIFKACLS